MTSKPIFLSPHLGEVKKAQQQEMLPEGKFRRALPVGAMMEVGTVFFGKGECL